MEKRVRRVAVTPSLTQNPDGSWSGFYPGRGPVLWAVSKEELLSMLGAEAHSWMGDPGYRAFLRGEVDLPPGVETLPEGWEVESISRAAYDLAIRKALDPDTGAVEGDKPPVD